MSAGQLSRLFLTILPKAVGVQFNLIFLYTPSTGGWHLRTIFHSDGDCVGEFFSVGLVIGICKLQGYLVLSWLQFELPLRLRLAIVLVRGIEWDGLTLRHKSATVNDYVVMAAVLLESRGSRREFVPAVDLEPVRKRARHGVTILDVGERHAVAGTLGGGERRGWCRSERGGHCCCGDSGGGAEKLAAGARVLLMEWNNI